MHFLQEGFFHSPFTTGFNVKLHEWQLANDNFKKKFVPGTPLNLTILPIMRRLLSLVFIICISADIYSQSSSISGVIADSIEKKNVANSVIALMRRSDSVLFHFTRADAAGRFSFPDVPQGRFIIMVTHPLFGDYFDTLSVPSAGNIDLENYS